MNIKDFKAKTPQQGGTSWCDHTTGTINVVATACNLLLDTKRAEEELPGVREQCMYSSGFHDLYKVTEYLQKYYNEKLRSNQFDTGFSDEDGSDPMFKGGKALPHNVGSWAFLRNNTSLGETNENDCVHSGVLYHHVVNGEVGEVYGTPSTIVNSMSEEDFNRMCEAFKFVCDYMEKTYSISEVNGKKVELVEVDSKIDKEVVYPLMKKYTTGRTGPNIWKELDKFARYFIVRSMTVFADRLVSSMGGYTSDFASNNVEFISEEIYSLTSMRNRFNFITPDFLESVGYDRKRIDKQFEYVRELMSCKNSILSANAGFGKTLIGVIYSVLIGKKTIWVVPTNAPAYSTWLSINKELSIMGMKNVTTALYHTGDYLYGDENADILVTNIDTFLGYMIKNNVASKLATLFASTIICDEFHELVNNNKPMFAAFIGTVYTLMRYTKANVLCMSATAHRLDKYFWNTRGEEDFIKYVKGDIYGKDIPLRLNVKVFSNGISSLNIASKDTIVVAETKRDAIEFGVKNEAKDYYYLHANFPDTWRDEKLNHVLDKYGKNSKIESRSELIGTSMLGYALDITTTNMYDFTTSPDTTIQRGGGRVARFGIEDNEIPTYNLCIDESKRHHRIIEDTYNYDLWKEWCACMKEYSGQIITRGELYGIYDNFIEERREKYEKMLYEKFNKSSESLTNMKPYRVMKRIDDDKKSLPAGKLTYRGSNSSIYVVARMGNGDYSEPIVVDSKVIYDKDNEYNYYARKAQYKYFVEKLGKDELDRTYGIYDPEKRTRSKQSFDTVKFEVARHRETPLFLLNARFSPKVGLIMDYTKDDSDIDGDY
jgi:hypothetical protein